MAERQKWTFAYTAAQLEAAALKQRDLRLSRLQWWKDKMQEVMKEVRESGIEINESIAASYSNKFGNAPQVMVRADLQGRLVECHQRIQLHDRLSHEYEGWAQACRANQATSFNLQIDDWLFFFGKDQIKVEEEAT